MLGAASNHGPPAALRVQLLGKWAVICIWGGVKDVYCHLHSGLSSNISGSHLSGVEEWGRVLQSQRNPKKKRRYMWAAVCGDLGVERSGVEERGTGLMEIGNRLSLRSILKLSMWCIRARKSIWNSLTIVKARTTVCIYSQVPWRSKLIDQLCDLVCTLAAFQS